MYPRPSGQPLSSRKSRCAAVSIPPAIDADGALKLKGYFLTTQQPWYFEFRYVYEHPMWKLIGLSVASSPK